MVHHYSEKSDYNERIHDAQIGRFAREKEILASLSPEDKARFENACDLVETFANSAEGRGQMFGVPGFGSYEPHQTKELFKTLLLLSGAAEALTQKDGPA